MCLDRFREPTEEERNKTYIGYKIVKKIKDNTYKSEYHDSTYTIGEETVSNRLDIKLTEEEIDSKEINLGIHLYINKEVEKYPFKEEDEETLIKVEYKGEDIVGYGKNSYPYPCMCQYLYPYLYLYSDGVVVLKVKVLGEVK